MKKPVTAALFAAAAILTSFWLISASSAEEDESELNVYELLDLFSEAFQTVRTQYVEEVEVVDLIQGAVQGMLSSLDPHSGYLTPEQMDKTEELTSGEFGGLGIEVTMENGWVKVVSPIDDTPAARAGLQSGDFVTGIDGVTVLGMTLDDAVKLMRGPVGSEIVLTIEREGAGEPFDVEITRDVIKIAAAEVRLEAGVMVVRVKTFNRQTLTNVADGIEEQAEIAGGLEELPGIILDLRNNPGGLLTTAVEVSDAFLGQGDIVSVRGRDVQGTENFMAEPGDLAEGKPMVVLVNGGSASASEIVAGALQDHKRAVVVGTKTFGKGSVQVIVNLGPGRGGLRLTTARYYTPSGRSIQAQGIVPDIHFQGRRNTEGPAEEPEDEVKFTSEADLVNSLDNDSLMNVEEDEEDSEALLQEMQELRGKDPQLAYAIDVLAAISALEQN